MTSRARLWSNLLLAGALLAFSMSAAAWDLCRYQAERRASMDTTGATRVIVNARAGDLWLRPAATPKLAARGEACASSEKYLDEIDLRVKREGDVIRVDVLMPAKVVGFLAAYASLDLTVEVPAELPIELTDSSGDIEARDVRIVKLTDSSGDISLRNVGDEIEIWDSSGDLRVEQAGRVRVQDSSGDIVIVGAAEVHVPSDSSGDITIRQVRENVLIEQDSSGDIRISDVGGDVTVLRDSSGDLKVSGVRGNVRVPD